MSEESQHLLVKYEDKEQYIIYEVQCSSISFPFYSTSILSYYTLMAELRKILVLRCRNKCSRSSGTLLTTCSS